MQTLCLQAAQDTKPTHINTHLDPINVIAMDTNTTPNTLCNENILLLTKGEAREWVVLVYNPQVVVGGWNTYAKKRNTKQRTHFETSIAPLLSYMIEFYSIGCWVKTLKSKAAAVTCDAAIKQDIRTLEFYVVVGDIFNSILLCKQERISESNINSLERFLRTRTEYSLQRWNTVMAAYRHCIRNI